MLSFAFILAMVSCAFEITIAEKVPAYRHLAGKYVLVNLAGSMVLSYSLATLFGAGGLIAMTGAIMATLMAIPYYKGRQAYEAKEEEVKRGFQAIRDLFLMIYKILLWVTLPVHIYRAIRTRAQQRWSALRT